MAGLCLIELSPIIDLRQARQDVWRRKQAYRQRLQSLGRRVRCFRHAFHGVWTGHYRFDSRAAELLVTNLLASSSEESANQTTVYTYFDLAPQGEQGYTYTTNIIRALNGVNSASATARFIAFCLDKNIDIVCLPLHTSYLL